MSGCNFILRTISLSGIFKQIFDILILMINLLSFVHIKHHETQKLQKETNMYFFPFSF